MQSRTIRTVSTSWAGKTYQEIREIGEQNGSVLILPIGSIEQHGQHMPVATDTILADAVANLGAARVEDSLPVLVAPPLWTGYSPHHQSFGGTISLRHETLLHCIEDIATSALENGFDSLFLLNGHGGNGPVVDSAVNTIGRRHPDVEVMGLSYFELADSFIEPIRESDDGGMSHGGEFETSLVLYLQSELVHEDEVEGTYLDEPYNLGTQDLLVGGPLSVYRPFAEYSPSGAIGAPELATAEKGERIYEDLGNEMEDLLLQIHNRNK